jgi:hypothetical protein
MALANTMAYFRGGVTKSATIVLDRDPVIDTHSPGGAQTQVSQYKEIAATIEEVIRTLKLVQFDESRSFWDVTTLMISSEFSRTFRQGQDPIDATGTDHNPLRNTVLFGGKKIRGGLVVGASDLTETTSDGKWASVSKAHLKMDSSLMMPMAKPFDYSNGQALNVLPEAFDLKHYLSIQSVVNTAMSMFNVRELDWFRVAGKNAPILPFILR